MSAIIQQTQHLYKKVIFVELIVLVSISLLIFIKDLTPAFSFFLGGLASLLPFCVFVFWVFFKTHKNSNKMSAFYRGEGVKWLVTIVLMVVILKSYAGINVLFFFGGYILFLSCNSLLPIVLIRWQK